MPTNSRVFLKPFIGGLNTEGSDTDDIVLNTSDELNCTILPQQMRGRRYGFNIEQDGRWIDTGEDIIAHSLYHWNNADEDNSFIVVQINRKLYIFKDMYPITYEDPLQIIDMDEYFMIGETDAMEFASSNQLLFVVCKGMRPIVIEYDSETDTFKDPVLNNPKFRDFNGVDDGLAIDEMPTDLSRKHLYNLKNQGWDKNVYNPTWSAPKTRNLLPDSYSNYGLFYDEYAASYGTGKYPANNMQWFLGKEKSGEYNTTDLLNTYFGNTPATKGHFIVDYINRSRSVSSGINLESDESFTSTKVAYTKKYFNGTGNNANNLIYPENYADQYNKRTDVIQPSKASFTIDFPATVTGVLREFKLYLKDNAQCKYKHTEIKIRNGRQTSRSQTINFPHFKRNRYNYYIFSKNFEVSLIGYDKNGNGTTVFTKNDCHMTLTNYTDTTDTFTFTTNNINSYKTYKVKISFPNTSDNQQWAFPTSVTAHIQSIETRAEGPDPSQTQYVEGLPSNDLLQESIKDIESFGGRIFYLCGNTVLFSQTLSTYSINYDKCYQDADPTSEEVSDIVATDGGMIQLLTIGKGKALKSFYRGVIVFGDKEVTGILSNSINLFSAESYDVVKITTAGLTSKHSVVETDNNIFYWSNHGIYMIGIDENNNISSQCISIASIQSWYLNLDQYSKDNSVGYYDYANNRIYWYYPTTDNKDKLDSCLVYDLNYNCFMPQYIDAGTVVRDNWGNFEGLFQYQGSLSNDVLTGIYIDRNTGSEPVTVDNINHIVYNSDNEIVGYIQDKYITDCNETLSVNYITPTIFLRAGGNRVIAGEDNVVLSQLDTTYYDRKSAGLILISDGRKFSFGDFNDREFRDWDVSPYESYLVSRPITLGDTYFNKQTPIMQTLFKRTEEAVLKPYTPPTDNYEYYGISTEFFNYDGVTSYNTGYIIDNEAYLKRMAATFVDLPETLDSFVITLYGFNEDVEDNPTFVTLDTATFTRADALAQGGYTVEFDSITKYKSYKVSVVGTFTEGNTALRLNVPVQIALDDVDKSKGKFSGWYYYNSGITEPLILRKSEDYGSDATEIDLGVAISNLPKYITKVTTTFSGAGRYFSDFEPGDPVPQYDWTATVTYTDNIVRDISDALQTSFAGYPNIRYSTACSIVLSNFQDNWTFTPSLPDWIGYRYNVEYVIPMYLPFIQREIVELNASDYVAPSGAIIRMRWGWSVNPLSNRWDMLQNGYRPQKDFMNDDYVESRLHIHGRGKAFQIEIRNDDNKDFRLAGLNIITRSPQ